MHACTRVYIHVCTWTITYIHVHVHVEHYSTCTHKEKEKVKQDVHKHTCIWQQSILLLHNSLELESNLYIVHSKIHQDTSTPWTHHVAVGTAPSPHFEGTVLALSPVVLRRGDVVGSPGQQLPVTQKEVSIQFRHGGSSAQLWGCVCVCVCVKENVCERVREGETCELSDYNNILLLHLHVCGQESEACARYMYNI